MAAFTRGSDLPCRAAPSWIRYSSGRRSPLHTPPAERTCPLVAAERRTTPAGHARTVLRPLATLTPTTLPRCNTHLPDAVAATRYRGSRPSALGRQPPHSYRAVRSVAATYRNTCSLVCSCVRAYGCSTDCYCALPRLNAHLIGVSSWCLYCLPRFIHTGLPRFTA